jgi:hypothetical protein
MKQPSLCTIIAVLASLLLIGSEVLAQGDAPRFEIGGQFSLLSLNKPSSQSDEFVSGHADPGFGARFTYNVTNNIAFEAEGNFFPGRNFDSEGSFFSRPNNDIGVPSGKIYQGQFGLKAGKRFKKVGLFIKIRPGFVRFTKVSQLTGFRAATFISIFNREIHYENAEFRLGKATYLSTDVGGVVEFYPSRRIVTRLDVGDTIIRYGIYREPLGVICAATALFPCPTQVFERPAETRHNLQFSAGIGIRF